MKKLGVFIGDIVYRDGNYIEKNTFVWYETDLHSMTNIGTWLYDISIWSLKGGYPNGRKPDAKFKTTRKHLIENTVIPIKEVPNKYCIEWENQQWQIRECEVRYDYYHDYEWIMTLKLDQFGSNNYCHWDWEGERALSVLKTATVNRIHRVNDLVMPVTVKEELKKSLEQDVIKSALNSCYGMGGFTTRPVLSPEEIGILFDSMNKETKTMEKKMTETDRFLKRLNDITITSTYSKLKYGFENTCYIYYPEMEITEDMADTLLTVLLMAKREYIRKVVFNPEKGTTTISKSVGDPVTVRCRDGEFNYILGYEMARSKMYLGHSDYNWFNKIKNHRKTHIEYTEKPTEPKAKRTSKKGGKK